MAGVALPNPVATATIVRGVTTNRVKVRRRRARSSTATSSPRTRSTARAGYKLDREVHGRGRGYKVICASFPPDELAAIDAGAAAAQMARSHWLRQAAKYFLAWLADPRQAKP